MKRRRQFDQAPDDQDADEKEPRSRQLRKQFNQTARIYPRMQIAPRAPSTTWPRLKRWLLRAFVFPSPELTALLIWVRRRPR